MACALMPLLIKFPIEIINKELKNISLVEKNLDGICQISFDDLSNI